MHERRGSLPRSPSRSREPCWKSANKNNLENTRSKSGRGQDTGVGWNAQNKPWRRSSPTCRREFALVLPALTTGRSGSENFAVRSVRFYPLSGLLSSGGSFVACGLGRDETPESAMRCQNTWSRTVFWVIFTRCVLPCGSVRARRERGCTLCTLKKDRGQNRLLGRERPHF